MNQITRIQILSHQSYGCNLTIVICPVIKNSIKTPVSYLSLAGEDKKKKLLEYAKSESAIDKTIPGLLKAGVAYSTPFWIVKAGMFAYDTKVLDQIIKKVQPMIDEICNVIVRGIS